MSKKRSLLIFYATIIAMILGGLVGWIMGEDALIFAWMGDLFLNALKMVAVPLIVAAVITGVASLGDVRKLGRPGGVTFLIFIITMLMSATIGMSLAEIFNPGGDFKLIPQVSNVGEIANTSIGDVLIGLISSNIIASAANMELLQLIVFAIIFGAALTVTGEKGKPVTDFFEGLNNVMMVIVGWIMIFTPIGVFGLIIKPIAQAGGGDEILTTFGAVGNYMIVSVIGLLLQSVILLIILYLFTGRALNYLRDVFPALLTAFSTSSSSATVPLSMECATEHGLKKTPVRFVIPLGSTVNMNGTAVYQGVACIFLAQVYNVQFGIEQYFLVAATATLASIGSAGIPQGGHVMTLMLFSIVGIPAEGFALILSVDWIMDRARTTLNVWGDLVSAAILDRFMMDENKSFD